MAVVTKCIKIKVKTPRQTTWDELGKLLRELRYASSKVLNLTIQRCYEWHTRQMSEKEKTGVYPKEKEVYGCALSTHIYREARHKYKLFHSGNLIQTIQMAIARWKHDQAEIMRLQKSIPSYKLNAPLYVAAQSYTLLSHQDDEYALSVGLISSDYSREQGVKHTQYQVLLEVNDQRTRVILNRILSGTYKRGFAQVVYSEKKREWFVLVSYSLECEQEKVGETIMGVHIGITHPVYIALSSSLHRYKIARGEIEQFRKQLLKRKKALQAQGTYCADGRRGHGTKTRLAPLDFARQRVADFRNTANHKYSRFVVDIAKKHQVCCIQMANLSGISEKHTFLKGWSYYDLQQKIEYKAREAGISVHYVELFYTAARCSQCGQIAPLKREDQEIFKCSQCTFSAHADYNTAKNLATLDIEKLIQEAKKKSEEEKRS